MRREEDYVFGEDGAPDYAGEDPDAGLGYDGRACVVVSVFCDGGMVLACGWEMQALTLGRTSDEIRIQGLVFGLLCIARSTEERLFFLASSSGIWLGDASCGRHVFVLSLSCITLEFSFLPSYRAAKLYSRSV